VWEWLNPDEVAKVWQGRHVRSLQPRMDANSGAPLPATRSNFATTGTYSAKVGVGARAVLAMLRRIGPDCEAFWPTDKPRPSQPKLAPNRRWRRAVSSVATLIELVYGSRNQDPS
jgi:hypothetical protein